MARITYKKKKYSFKKYTKKVNKNKNVQYISEIDYNKMEYPYYKQQITKSKLMEDFKKLKKYKTTLLKENPINQKLKTISGRLVIFKEDYDKNSSIYNITDYFSDTCRVKCLNNLRSNETPFEYFQKNKDMIYKNLIKKNGQLTYHDINEYLYTKTSQCTNFKSTVMMSILNLFKPKNYLDPSAGWGDRLISAIAYGCSYTGVDPSKCMEPIYHKIINELVPRKEKYKYQMIHDGFENAIIPDNTYDLVFTSPPFFDFELYETDKGQSVEKFNTLEKWLNGFMYPYIEKSFRAMTVGGHFGLYISNYKDISFTKDIFQYIKKNLPNLKYYGDIHNWTKNNPKVVRTMFFWKKVAN
jgi:hypothetical protein